MKTQKTKKSFKKKALLSSLSMLLVATVAVGSATFAWFTSSTTTTANGLNVKTVKSSELVISKSDRQWKQTINYAQSGLLLRPASSADGTNWFKADAAAKGAFTRKGDFSSVGSEKGSYVFAEELNIANKGEAAVTGVTITITNFTNNYGRIALVEVNDDGSAISGKTFAGSIIDTEGEKYDAAKTTTTTEKITPTTSTTISVGDLAGKTVGSDLGGAKYYKLYVWFEGQDTDCFDTNAGQSIGDITFSIAGTTEDQKNPTNPTT